MYNSYILHMQAHTKEVVFDVSRRSGRVTAAGEVGTTFGLMPGCILASYAPDDDNAAITTERNEN